MSIDQSPPATGNDTVDEALARVAALDDDLANHPRVLREAGEALANWLRED